MAAYEFAQSLWDSGPENDRRASHLKYATQYLGRPIASLTEFDAAPSSPGTPNPTPVFRSPRNLTRTLIDTAMSQFAKTETRVAFVTDGGTPAQQQRSQECTDAANALIEQTGTERELRRAALHACLFDLGSVKFIETPDGPIAEHIPAWQVMYEPVDAHKGRPTIRVERHTADKDALIAEYAGKPEGEETNEAHAERMALIDEIKQSTSAGLTTIDHTMSGQHCLVYELWRLPVGRYKGRHVICTDSALLLDEEWTDEKFPAVDFGWSQQPFGPYPTSIAAINAANQDELDGVAQRISQCLRQMAVPQFIEEGPNGGDTAVTQVRTGSEAIGDIIQVAPGKKLTKVSAGNVLGPELPAHEDRVWARGFEMCGINQQSSVGTRPAGLNSAPAQREWNEIRQDRLSIVALDYQRAHVEAADRLLDAVQRIPDYEITIRDPNGRWLRRMKTSDLELDRADYVIQAFPISALPMTPTGRLAAAADLLQMGAIDRDDFKELVQLPDLKAKLDLGLASRKATEKIIAKMLSERRYIAPIEMLDLNYALKYASVQYLNGIADDMPHDQLDLLQNWIGNVLSLQQKAAPPPAPPNMQGTSIAPLAPPPLAGPVAASDMAGAMTAAA